MVENQSLMWLSADMKYCIWQVYSSVISLSPPSLQMLKYKIRKEELHKYHIAQADAHFSEERARAMELQARRLRLHRRSPSAASEATHSEVLNDI